MKDDVGESGHYKHAQEKPRSSLSCFHPKSRRTRWRWSHLADCARRLTLVSHALYAGSEEDLLPLLLLCNLVQGVLPVCRRVEVGRCGDSRKRCKPVGQDQIHMGKQLGQQRDTRGDRSWLEKGGGWEGTRAIKGNSEGE